MTKQVLREKIANKLFKSAQRFVGLDVCGECCNFGEDECRHENATGKWVDMKECPQDRLWTDTLADQILALIKEAGYVTPEECKQCLSGRGRF